MKRTPLAAVLVSVLAAASSAAAAPPPAVAADMEVDPTAYVLDGYSLHVGLGWKRVRVDLGAFALTVPAFVHGNDAFTSSFDGFGVKLQYFPLHPGRALFLGLDTAVARTLIRLDGTELASRDHQLTAGAHIGWRFDLSHRLYVTPWIGLSYAFSVDDVTLADQTYASSPWIIFPAVHLGYRL